MGNCCFEENDIQLEDAKSIEECIILLHERLELIHLRKKNINDYINNSKSHNDTTTNDNNTTNTNDDDDSLKNETRISLIEHLSYLSSVTDQLMIVKKLLVKYQEVLNWPQTKNYIRTIINYSNRFVGNDLDLFSSVRLFESWIDLQLS